MTLILQEVEKNGLTEKKDEYTLVESGGRGPEGSGGTVVHNNTLNKQGGAANEYYHLTAAELAKLLTDVTQAELEAAKEEMLALAVAL